VNRPWRDLRRNKTARFGAVVIGIVVLAALLADLAPHDPEQRHDVFRAEPSADHWLGTDENGFDVFSRLVHGARASLGAALAAVTFALLIGVPLGLCSGWYTGLVDSTIMRAVDVMLAFPSVLLAIAIAAALGGGSIETVVLAVGSVMVPRFIRQVRAAVLQVKHHDYVMAARALGATDRRILFRTVLPNCLAPILILSTLSIGLAILDAAGLSFLGLGPPASSPEWGVMLRKGVRYLERSEQWLVLPPGIAIAMTVLGFNLLGDGLRDAFDPKRS